MFAQAFTNCVVLTEEVAVFGNSKHSAPEKKRCTTKTRHSQCSQWFSKEDKRKRCPKCRDKANQYNHSDKGKETRKRFVTSDKGIEGAKCYNGSDKGKASRKMYKASDKGKACNKKYDISDRGRATRKVNWTAYHKSDKYKEYQNRYENSEKRKAYKKAFWASANGKAYSKKRYGEFGPWLRLSNSLSRMVTGKHTNPITFKMLGIFEDIDDVQAHFESTFVTWMNWENHGKLHKDALPNTIWQIGHHIPKIWYRHDDVDEVKKAWSRDNLFAQCAVENISACDRNILSEAQWLALKLIWPKQCTGMTDEDAWQWAKDNADNATRKAERLTVVNTYQSASESSSDDSDSEIESD